MKRNAGLLIVFGYAVLLFEALRMGLAWWNGELTEVGLEQWLLVAALPLLAWVAWRMRRPTRSGPRSPAP
jgi:hypothetical protein